MGAGLFAAAAASIAALPGCLQHLAASGGVDGQHPGPQLRRCRHGAGHLMRDVMELQIEKYAVAQIDQPADEGWSFRRKQRAADLDPADAVLETKGQFGRVHGVVDVERD
jgi:hypothetical protein